MDENEGGLEQVKKLLRFTSERLPYRRAGLAFSGTRVVELPVDEVSAEQLSELYADPVIAVAVTIDAGASFVEMPEEEALALLPPPATKKTK